MHSDQRRVFTAKRVLIFLAVIALSSPLLWRWWLNVGKTTHVEVPTNMVDYARDALGELTIVDPLTLDDYDRDFFGPAWQPPTPTPCDTRNEVLKAWLTDIALVDQHDCSVASGWFVDPYTGHLVEFIRGPETSKEVHIDHVVALSDAWRKGADQWDGHKAQEFANDPLNLLPTQGWVNEEKGGYDAASWLPPNEGFRCYFAVQQVLVKDKYDLGVSDAEAQALHTTLNTCD